MRAEVIPCIGLEDAGLDVGDAPVGADVEDGAVQAGPGEVAANNGDGGADPVRALGFVEWFEAVDVGGVEKDEAGRGGGGRG